MFGVPNIFIQGHKMKSRKRTTTPFARHLISIMDEKSIGVREASRLAGVGASTIMSWRSGALPEDYLAVKKLAEAMGTTMSFLLTGEDDAKPTGPPSITEVFDDGGEIFDGYAKITIQRLVPKLKNSKKRG